MYHMEKESNPAIVNDCVQLMNGLIKILLANKPDLFEFVILKKAMSSCFLSLGMLLSLAHATKSPGKFLLNLKVRRD